MTSLERHDTLSHGQPDCSAQNDNIENAKAPHICPFMTKVHPVRWWIPHTKKPITGDQWIPISQGRSSFPYHNALCHYLCVRNHQKSRHMGCVARTRKGWWKFHGHTSWGLRRTWCYQTRHIRARHQNHTGSRNTDHVGGAGTGHCTCMLCKKNMHHCDLKKVAYIFQAIFSNKSEGGTLAVGVGWELTFYCTLCGINIRINKRNLNKMVDICRIFLWMELVLFGLNIPGVCLQRSSGY